MDAGGLSTQISKSDAQKESFNTPAVLELKMQDSGLIDFNPQPPKEENETAGEKDAEEEKLRLEAEEIEKKEAAK